jgi:hypothetical protein
MAHSWGGDLLFQNAFWGCRAKTTFCNVVFVLALLNDLAELGIDGVGAVVEIGRLLAGQGVQGEGAHQGGLKNDDIGLLFLPMLPEIVISRDFITSIGTPHFSTFPRCGVAIGCI